MTSLQKILLLSLEFKLKIVKLKIKSTTPEMTLDHNVTVLPTFSILEMGSHKYSMTYDTFNFNQAQNECLVEPFDPL